MRLLPVLLCCALLVADDAALQLGPGDFELLPLDELERGRLFREHGALVERMQALGRRHAQLGRQLDELEPDSDAQARVRTQQAEVAGRLAPLFGELTAILRAEFGIDDAHLARVKAAPVGERRVARYAHAQVLAHGALSEAETRLFEALVAALDGAQSGWRASRARLEQLGLEESARRAVEQGLAAQEREAEQRFWIVVDIVLSDAQTAAIMAELPYDFTRIRDFPGHLLRLPGLSPSQTARLQAGIAEIEAESAADDTEVRRLGQELRRRDLERDERAALQEALREARGRLASLREEVFARLQGSLSAEQRLALAAIPPYVSPNDRNLRPERLFAGLELSPAQEATLASMREEVDAQRRAYQEETREIQRMGADYGPDSPQQMMMQSMMMGVQAEGQSTLREAVRHVLLEVLRTEQVSDWMLGL